MLHLTGETSLMKKINLTIPSPCQENWDAMTPSEQGKFCGSCQKTVIDFTTMSDRQIAEFFKKTPSSVCGRVYNDQLNRDIQVPKKRIPWIRYFFQFTWPAFILFLKSCGEKVNTKGKIALESTSNHQTRKVEMILGNMFPQITPVDTSVALKPEVITRGEIRVDTAFGAQTDSVTIPEDSLTQMEPVYKSMDTVVVTSYQSTTGRIVMGGISTCKVEVSQLKNDSTHNESSLHKDEIDFTVYPNPVRAGSLLTISFKNINDLPERIQVLSSSGQLISQVKQTEKNVVTVRTIQIPSNLTAGVYFLQANTINKKIKTTKIIVTK